MEQGKIECAKAEDRDNLVMILARNGYTVRQIREKKPKGNAYSYIWNIQKLDVMAIYIYQPPGEAMS